MRSKASPTFVGRSRRLAGGVRTGIDSPVRADWSSTATPSPTAPSTGTTSPCGSGGGRPVRSRRAAPPRARRRDGARAVRGTRDSSAVISRRARRSAKLSRILAAGIHQRDDGGRQLLAESEGGGHRERRDDIEPDVAAPQAGDDLDHQRRQHRQRGTAAQIGADQASKPASRAANPAARPKATRPARNWRTTVSVR